MRSRPPGTSQSRDFPSKVVSSLLISAYSCLFFHPSAPPLSNSYVAYSWSQVRRQDIKTHTATRYFQPYRPVALQVSRDCEIQLQHTNRPAFVLLPRPVLQSFRTVYSRHSLRITYRSGTTSTTPLHKMHSYIAHVPDQQAVGGMTHQQHHYPLRQQYEQAYHEELSESPQRLHIPTPLITNHHIYDQGRTFGSTTPHQEEHRDMPLEYQRDQQYSDQQQHYSASAAVPSGMTLAAVAAAVENLHNNQNQYAPDEQGESSGSLDEAHESLKSPPSKRLFIHPYSHSHVLPTAPPTAPACTSSEASASASAPSASSSTGTFSTHNPPTPGTAPPSKLDFVDIAASKSATGPADSEGYTSYTIPSQSHSQPQSRLYSQSQTHTQPMVSHSNYQNPPQTAPLPTRSAEFDDASIPPTPASAHPSLHYTQPHQPHISPALAAAAEHHAKYPGEYRRVP